MARADDSPDKPFSEDKHHAPATVRNRDAIVAVLADVLPKHGLVLEIASGSGEHAMHFAERFPALNWQPSDKGEKACRSIAAWRAECGQVNVIAPIQLDVEEEQWPVLHADALVCINMVHISPWSATKALFQGAARSLHPGAPLYLYGPYFRDDVMTAPSNRAFDQALRQRDPFWGVRHINAMDELAKLHGFERSDLIVMPANNLSLVFRRL